MSFLLENGHSAAIRDTIPCAKCTQRCSSSPCLQGHLAAHHGEVGQVHEGCVWRSLFILNVAHVPLSSSVEDVAEMIAVGLGLPRDTIKEAGKYGQACIYSLRDYLLIRLHRPHLLGPTASDLTKYGTKDTILAGFHTDLNCLTIHGRSRYPGLNIWARNSGKRIPVRFPPTGRYLLVQAGTQIEHLTGGLIKAGFHEVVVNEATVDVSCMRTRDFFCA